MDPRHGPHRQNRLSYGRSRSENVISAICCWLALTVTACSLAPYTSCHAVSLYVPGRHILDLERPILARHLKVRIRENGDVRLHPRMNVAFHRNTDLRVREHLIRRRASPGLRLVPPAINPGSGIHVVRGLVRVGHSQMLSLHQRNHVRYIHAAILVQRRRLWNFKPVLREVAPQVDHHILQRAILSGHHVLPFYRRRMQLGAVGHRGHVDLPRPARHALKLNHARHRTRRLGIHRPSRRIGSGLVVRWRECVWLFLCNRRRRAPSAPPPPLPPSPASFPDVDS